jgi:hypothetical protein
MTVVYILMLACALGIGVCLGIIYEWREAKATREAALREAAAMAETLSFGWWATYKNIHSPHRADPHWQGMSDGADDVATAILTLIGEKK